MKCNIIREAKILTVSARIKSDLFRFTTVPALKRLIKIGFKIDKNTSSFATHKTHKCDIKCNPLDGLTAQMAEWYGASVS